VLHTLALDRYERMVVSPFLLICEMSAGRMWEDI
jgi:hypothetical protein